MNAVGLVFRCHCALRRVCDVRRRHVELLLQVVELADFTEVICDADAAHDRRALFGEHFGNGAAQCADDRVVLRSDDGAALGGILQDGFFVERFQRVDVDDGGVNLRLSLLWIIAMLLIYLFSFSKKTKAASAPRAKEVGQQ